MKSCINLASCWTDSSIPIFLLNNYWINLENSIKYNLYIRNLKYAHLTPIFWQHNIHLVSSYLPTQIQINIVHRKTGFKRKFSRCTNMNNHLFCFEKTITMYLKAKNYLHATQISSFKYVFIIFFKKKTDAKIYIFCSRITFVNLQFRSRKPGFKC